MSSAKFPDSVTLKGLAPEEAAKRRKAWFPDSDSASGKDATTDTQKDLFYNTVGDDYDNAIRYLLGKPVSNPDEDRASRKQLYLFPQSVPNPATLRTHASNMAKDRAKEVASREKAAAQDSNMRPGYAYGPNGTSRLLFPEGVPDAGTCTLPPQGWRCFGNSGHAGPCAAFTTDPNHIFYDPSFGGRVPAWKGFFPEPTQPVIKRGGDGPWDGYSSALGQPCEDPDAAPVTLNDLFPEPEKTRPVHGGYPDAPRPPKVQAECSVKDGKITVSGTMEVYFPSPKGYDPSLSALWADHKPRPIPENPQPIEQVSFMKPKKRRNWACLLGFHEPVWSINPETQQNRTTCKHCSYMREDDPSPF